MSAEEQLGALERGHYAEGEGVGLLALAGGDQRRTYGRPGSRGSGARLA